MTEVVRRDQKRRKEKKKQRSATDSQNHGEGSENKKNKEKKQKQKTSRIGTIHLIAPLTDRLVIEALANAAVLPLSAAATARLNRQRVRAAYTRHTRTHSFTHTTVSDLSMEG